MDWKQVGKVVSKAAPVAGLLLGGPVGAIAGAAGSLIASCLGVDPEPDAVAAAIQANPEAMVKLKEIEFEHKNRLLEWQTQMIQADLANVQGARAREVEMARFGNSASWATSIISTIVTFGFFAMLWLVLADKAKEYGEAAMILLGSLSMAFSAVVNYYLGSSLGSSQKTNLLAQAPSVLTTPKTPGESRDE